MPVEMPYIFGEVAFLVEFLIVCPFILDAVVTDPMIVDDFVLGASSFYTANRPILAAAALRYRRDPIFRGVDGQDVRTTGDAPRVMENTSFIVTSSRT
jgi:hypothetical protein